MKLLFNGKGELHITVFFQSVLGLKESKTTCLKNRQLVQASWIRVEK